MKSESMTKKTLAFIICLFFVGASLVSSLIINPKSADACGGSGGFYDYGGCFGVSTSGCCGGGFGGYNFVQYPNLNYVYNQNPARNASPTNSYNFVQYPSLRYVYYQDPSAPRPVDAFNTNFVQYPYLQYVYFNNPNRSNTGTQTPLVSNSYNYPQTNWSNVYSPQQYQIGFNPNQSFGYDNSYYFGGSYNSGGFMMTSGY